MGRGRVVLLSKRGEKSEDRISFYFNCLSYYGCSRLLSIQEKSPFRKMAFSFGDDLTFSIRKCLSIQLPALVVEYLYR
ncbi:hypothetical protein X975_17691, partial [Stegodyphus mimosarum]